MPLTGRQLSALIGKVLITLPTCRMGVDHIGRNQFRFIARNHRAEPSPSPQSARWAVLLLAPGNFWAGVKY
jgi:hypothetical protein